MLQKKVRQASERDFRYQVSYQNQYITFYGLTVIFHSSLDEILAAINFWHVFLIGHSSQNHFSRRKPILQHILFREKDQFCNHSWSLESFHTLRIFVWKFNFHHVFFPKTRWMAWWKLNFHTKILRVWKDSKLQEWLQNWYFSLINMWSEYWLP